MNTFRFELAECLNNGEYNKAYDKLKELYDKSFRPDTQNDRANSLNILMEKYNKINESEKFNDITKIAFITEISNNMAHIFENKLRASKNEKEEYIKLRNDFFAIKKIILVKLIQIAKDNKDVIIGKTRDDTKEFNKDVVVLDLPGYGQLSWHTTLNRYGSKEMDELPEYKFEIDKSGGDTRANLNSKVLCGNYYENEMNTHNRLVKNVTKGREEELKRLLNIYEHISKNPNGLIKERDKLDESCELYGLLSEDNFNILVDNYYGYEIDNDENYKQEIREWRYEYPEEREDGDPIEEEKYER